LQRRLKPASSRVQNGESERFFNRVVRMSLSAAWQ
jgi:hypothetical protein